MSKLSLPRRFQVTIASHEVEHRNMRDARGALGPVFGRQPLLNNLTCSMTFVEEGEQNSCAAAASSGASNCNKMFFCLKAILFFSLPMASATILIL